MMVEEYEWEEERSCWRGEGKISIEVEECHCLLVVDIMGDSDGSDRCLFRLPLLDNGFLL